MRYHPRHWPWPLPALLAWGLAWGVWVVGRSWSGVGAALAASLVALACSPWGRSRWRRGLVALGFPVALLLSAPALLPPWAWLIPALVLLLLYPVHAWRDAPLFPTPPDALLTLPDHVPLSPAARVLDAGCGLGHGLQALRQAYPLAELHGWEWSRVLRWLCARRCPWAQVRRVDIWQADWSGFDMVYLFQRPESMARALAKAQAELRPGAWLVSLDFAATAWQPFAQYRTPGGKMVWVYRLPLSPLPVPKESVA